MCRNLIQLFVWSAQKMNADLYDLKPDTMPDVTDPTTRMVELDFSFGASIREIS